MSIAPDSLVRHSRTLDPASFPDTIDPSSPDSDLHAASPRLPEGTMVGDCMVTSHLASGSQAELYAARTGPNDVIVKIYHPTFIPVPGVVAAQRAGASHHIVPLIGDGRHRDSRYEVYPRYKSMTLKKLVSSGGCDEAFVRGVLVPQLGDALNFLNARGIVHGDVSPDNVLVTKESREIRLADFGVSIPLPPPGTLVPRRGKQEFAPRVAEYDGRIEITAGYDYGSLGILIAYCLTGISPIAYLSRSEADRVLRDGSIPDRLSDDIRALCIALVTPLGGPKDGNALIKRFLGTENRTKSLVGSTCRAGGSRLRQLEIGCSNGRMIRVDSMETLIDALEAHWGLAKNLVDAPRLRTFLLGYKGGDHIVTSCLEKARYLDLDTRVFILCAGLRREVYGRGAGKIGYRGKTYGNVIELLCDIRDNPHSPARSFLQGTLLAEYARIAGLGDAVASEAVRVISSSDDVHIVAASAIDVFTGNNDTLVLGGEPIRDVAELIDWLRKASLTQVKTAMGDSDLRRWLYRHGLDDVFKEVDSQS